MTIKYVSIEGYKYQLTEDAEVFSDIMGKTIKTKYMELAPGGCFLVRKGYAWNGPSGPSIDTKSWMRASLFHDAGYQMVRMKRLPLHYKPDLDCLMWELCLADKMWKFRANYSYKFVSVFGHLYCVPGSQPERVVLEAP